MSWCLVAVLALSGCAQVDRVFSPRDPAPTEPSAPAPSPEQPPAPVRPPPGQPRTAEALDSTTTEERQAARREAATAEAQPLGTTIASLGAVAEPGLWLKTPLVATPGRGRVEYAATGQTVALDLIPLNAAPGAGSRLSLAGFRAIGAPLTGLPELTVSRLTD